MKKNNAAYLTSESKQKNRNEFLNTFKSSPIPDDELFGIKNYKIHISPIGSAQ